MGKAQLRVDPICNGTVLDHINAGKALQVAEILSLKNPKDVVMIGMNLSSKKTNSGKKDILKIENRKLSAEEVSSIALVSPDATLVIIENYNVLSKSKLLLPKFVEGMIKCPNENCISNIEKIQSKFTVWKNSIMEVRCFYCEKKYSIDKVSFLI